MVSTTQEDGGEVFDELVGVEVSKILLVGLIRLSFGKRRDCELSIERDFVVRTSENPEGVVVEFRPYLSDWKPTGMNELISLFHSVVERASASPEALLRINFSDGRSLEVQPDPQFEGWNFTIAGVRYGQVAGGGLK
jgi:hypothetical protein